MPSAAPSAAPTTSPAPAFTTAPSVDPDVILLLDAIILTVPTGNTTSLGGMTGTDNSSLSPQSRARTWMLEEDELRDSLLLGSEERVRQRYVLVVFYYGAITNSTVSEDENDMDVTGLLWLQPDISECEWTGIECDMGSNTVVQFLHLGQSNLTGTLPAELAALTALREIDVHGNNLRGPLPENLLLAWQDLFWMDFSQNQFTGSIPGIIWTQLQVLRYVYLHDNFLTGEVIMEPAAAVDLNGTVSTNPFLEDVWLYNNMLVGSLPTWLVTLTSLQSWITFGNAMTGPLPDFGSANPDLVPQNLIFLDVSDNQLSGGLPESLLTVPSASLRYLYLDRNQLGGPLPPGNNPGALQEIWLHSNQFTGIVPERFGSAWLNLTEMRLHDNNVTGMLGGTDCTSRNWTALISDCSGKSSVTGVAEVTCPCCTACF
jgi:hypothetical protein